MIVLLMFNALRQSYKYWQLADIHEYKGERGKIERVYRFRYTATYIEQMAGYKKIYRE